ncbi:MAG TPA: hypothetical protein VKF32_10495 [Thermoanaerobaculia bacterium]|nr:hypothetical protein [Thermoanaerobaculia bacterium]
MARRRSKSPRRGEGPLGLIIGLALLIVVTMALFKIVPLHIHGNEVYDVMNEQANFGGMKQLDKIQYEIFRKAEEVGVPLQKDEIKVLHRGPFVVITAKYQETVDVFGYKYVYTFDRKVEKPVF